VHAFFGFLQICYPKRTDKPLYHGLVTQCKSLGLSFREAEEIKKPLQAQYDVVIDALFGFSFKGTPRPPFDALLEVCGLDITGSG
jgi:NAD(P)H-hydrate epimerase